MLGMAESLIRIKLSLRTFAARHGPVWPVRHVVVVVMVGEAARRQRAAHPTTTVLLDSGSDVGLAGPATTSTLLRHASLSRRWIGSGRSLRKCG